MFHEMVVLEFSSACSKVTLPVTLESPRSCATAVRLRSAPSRIKHDRNGEMERGERRGERERREERWRDGERREERREREERGEMER